MHAGCGSCQWARVRVRAKCQGVRISAKRAVPAFGSAHRCACFLPRAEQWALNKVHAVPMFCGLAGEPTAVQK
eukprot:364583-Chlamydomonas_euryale.AAC.3